MKEYDFKSAYNSIPLPDNLGSVIDNSINRARNNKKFAYLKPFTAAAAIILIFIFSVNVSPAFADAVYKVPGLSRVAELVMFDRGLLSAARIGYTQKVDKSVEDHGVKFTVREIIFDKKRLIVYYRIDSTLDTDDISIGEIGLTDGTGNKLQYFSGTNNMYDEKFKTNKYKEDIIDFQVPGEGEIPEDIIVDLKSLNLLNSQGQKVNTLMGNWAISIKLDHDMLNKEPRVLKYDNTSQIGPMKFHIGNVRIYPCSVYIDVDMDKDNPYKFCGFINPRLVDRDGNEYRGFGSVIESDDKRVLWFESNYFIDTRSLKLVFDGIFYIPKEPQIIEFDLKNGKIAKDPGYGLEFLYAKEELFPDENGRQKPAYVVSFKIKDQQIVENMKLPGALFGGIDFGKIYDSTGKAYESWGSGTTGPRGEKDGYIERFIYVGNMTAPPDVLKVEVNQCSKGTLEKLSIKLK